MSDSIRKSAIMRPSNPAEFEANAALAKQEIDEFVKDPIAHSVVVNFAKLWKFWYLVCGHKHLGRILLEYAK